jgi:hypothetical protein
MTAPTPPAIEVFFSYAHEDESLRDKLAKHLKLLERQGVIQGWHDRQILPGTEWQGQLDRHLETAQIILLLISADFLASDYCYDIEMKRALERHEAGDARVIPIILRPVDNWDQSPFGKLQALPKGGKPITRWPNEDEAFANVAQGIRAVVATFTSAREPIAPAASQPKTPVASDGMKQYNSGNSTGYQTRVEGGTVYIGSTHIQSQPAADKPPEAKTILFLAANPQSMTPQRLDQEVRDIREGLQLAKQRDRFVLEQRWAVRPRDVRRALLELKPQIVHFSGQTGAGGALALEDDIGNVQWVAPVALAGLFALFAQQIECVLLNACYSENQAEAIAQHIPAVIGMSDAMSGAAALEFAVAFYDALGAGESVTFAYQLGCNAIAMAGVAGDCVPVLKSAQSNS